jgi:hypothetical protein
MTPDSLFSSVGFLRTKERLEKACKQISKHLKKNGIFIMEPWLFPENILTGRLHATFINEDDIKAVRMSTVQIQGTKWNEIDHFLILTNKGVSHFSEKMKMGIFSKTDYDEALQNSGFSIHFDKSGLTGRGLFIGIKN